LVVALNHIGGNAQHGSAGEVDGVQITQSEWATHFEVPPGSQYSFSAISEHQMTAWVVGAFTDDQLKVANKNQLLIDVGLPNANAFINPVFDPSPYRFCINYFSVDASGDNFLGSSLKAIGYLYERLQWSDKSLLVDVTPYSPRTPWEASFVNEANIGSIYLSTVAELRSVPNIESLVFGPPPPQPGKCTDVNVTAEPEPLNTQSNKGNARPLAKRNAKRVAQ
jgi:hypothetical protein